MNPCSVRNLFTARPEHGTFYSPFSIKSHIITIYNVALQCICSFYIILKILYSSRKLKSVLTNRFLKFMIDSAQKDPVSYQAFYKDYSVFLKEGIVTSQSPIEKVSWYNCRNGSIYLNLYA